MGTQDDDNPGMKMISDAVEQGLPPRHVAEWTIECMKAGRFYIFTHPSMRRWVQKRAALVDADYTACLDDPRFADR